MFIFVRYRFFMMIGRNAEIQRLESLVASKQAEFAVLYGRRRVGKTYLIRQFFADKKLAYFQVTGLQKGSMKKQLAHFAESMSEVFMRGIKMAPFRSWAEAFSSLTQCLPKKEQSEKIVLFFDELPWLATSRSGFLEELDYYWNQHWSQNPNIILIVCGSSASWLIKNIIYNQGGLHNRCTAEMCLQPFTLREVEAFLDHRDIKLNQNHILDLYMALGGIPYYLSYVKKGLSATENIQQILCSQHAPLSDEFHKLFYSLFTNAEAYIELIQLIASKKEGITRIELEKQAKLSLGGGRLTERLAQLKHTNFIQSYTPWEKERGEYYKVIDEFCLFYLTWLKDKKQKRLTDDFWIKQIQKPTYHVWAGYAFEAVCHKHIKLIISALNIKMAESISSWRSSGAQIDLLIDRGDDAVTLCEIKYTDREFAIDKNYADVLTKKIEIFKTITQTKKQVFLALISANGLKTNAYSSQLIDGSASLKDLFF